MKTALLFLFVLVSVFSARGQKIKFSDPGNIWSYKATYMVPGYVEQWYFNLSYGSDTVIGGEVFKKLIGWGDGHPPDNPYIQEDESNGIVYTYNIKNGVKDTLINYNLQVGDSFSVPEQTCFHKVLSIDSIRINNIYHRVWKYLHSTYYNYYLVEGIGFIGELEYIFASQACYDGRYLLHDLLCFMNNGSKPVLSSAVAGFDNNAATCALSVADKKINSQKITVVPNPANTDAYISFSATIAEGKVVIYDMLGKSVSETAFINKDKITLPAITCSRYILL